MLAGVWVGMGSMHRCWWSREAVQPRERDWHLWAVAPPRRHGHLKEASWTVPEEGRFSPLGATPGWQGYSLSLGDGGLQPGEGTYGPSVCGDGPQFLMWRTIKMDTSKTFSSYKFHDNRQLGKEKGPYLFFSLVSFEPFISAYLPTFHPSGQC